MNKENKKVLRIFVIFIVLIIFSIVASLILEPQNKKRREDESNTVLNLISESILNFKEYSFTSESEFKYKYKPANIDNVLLVHLKKDEWSIYSTKGIGLNEIKTKEDLDKIDVIAFAISDFYSKTYQYNGSGVKVDISTEKVDIFFYNPKEEKFFMNRKLPYHELPKTTNSSHNYTHSVYDIESKVKESLGIKSSLLWAILGVLIVIIVIIGVMLGIRNFIRDLKKDKINKSLKMGNSKL